MASGGNHVCFFDMMPFCLMLFFKRRCSCSVNFQLVFFFQGLLLCKNDEGSCAL